MKILKKLLRPLIYILLAAVLIILVRAWDARSMPELSAWHETPIEEELLVQYEYPNIESYLQDEDQYIRNLFAKIVPVAHGKYDRFNPKSISYPISEDDNMNASFVFDPGEEHTKGVILLLHGLSDSPYHMRALGQVFRAQGFYVFGLRLPGHGTLPSGLLDITWKQWYDATQWGAEQVHKISVERGDVPFYMGGFSTGAALVLNYSFKSLNNKSLPRAEKIFLFSPAVGVSKMAMVSAWHKTLSWIPYFSQFKWLDILPEYDPAKYNSFTKNAGRQIFLLTKDNKRRIKEIEKSGQQNELPAIYSFQSLVDATVVAEDVFEMYQRIGLSKDVLFVFDINRIYKDFMKSDVFQLDPRNIRFSQESKPRLHMLINNPEIDTLYGPLLAGVYGLNNQNELVDLYPDDHTTWPEKYFAISHIAVPIAPDNPAYGVKSILGNLSVHGERNVLLIPSDDLSRIRYNPFFDLMEKEIQQFMLE